MLCRRSIGLLLRLSFFFRRRLTLQAPSLSETRKSELLASLRDFAEMYEQWYWKGSGRLARLGLPRPLVLALRRLRALLRKATAAVPELG